ncbi:hypothetical protein [Burkholderia glumae]|uniref:hypothetical protein n=1 Tax=Burkholderia glumae TaxID=337 RepID=UPI002150BB13|nr:hypothetical protein [Burkholderia glumae]
MTSLRCKAGDLARVVSAWNPALVGRVVIVQEMHKVLEREWRITLLGEPGITMTKNRRRLGIGNSMLAGDEQLEPLRPEELETTEQAREVSHAYLRCKVGDLAIVTRARKVEYIGFMVLVVAPADNGKHDWIAELVGPPVYGLDVRSSINKFCTEMACFDWNLTPIRPDLLDADIETHEVDHA